MFKYLALFALIAVAAAGSDESHAEIKSLHSDVRHDGFDYAVDTSNSIHAAQHGDEHGNINGDYEYVSPEGVHVKVVYKADEYGYQPHSDLLPTPHPIPEAILKSIEYNKAHPYKEEPHVAHAPHGHH